MFTKLFVLSLVERAVKTFCQTLLVIWPVGDATLHFWNVDWKKALAMAGMAAGASVLTSVISGPIGPDGSPSLVGEPPKQPEAILQDDGSDTVEAKIDLDDGPHEHALDGDEGEIPASTFTTPQATRYDPATHRITGNTIIPELDERDR